MSRPYVSFDNLQALYTNLKTILDSKASSDALANYVAQCQAVLSQVQTAGSDAVTKLATILGAGDYDSTSTYAVGSYCFYNSNFYRCSTAISTPEAWDATHWTATDLTSEYARILQEIQTEGATQIANVQAVYADDMAEVNAKVSRNTKEIANLVQKEGVVSISYPDSIYGRGEVPAGMVKYAEVGTLRGVTRGSNELAQNPLVTNDVNDWYSTRGEIAYDNGRCKFTITSISGSDNLSHRIFQNRDFIANHTYLMAFDITSPRNGNWGCDAYAAGIGFSFAFPFSANVKTQVQRVVTATTTANAVFDVGFGGYDSQYGYQVGDIIYFDNIILRDLTQYFSSDPSVDVSTLTLADIQQNYPELLVPSDYDTGSPVDTTYGAVDSEGVNLWDEEWEGGSLNPSTGVPVVNADTIRSVNFTAVMPSTAYYCKAGTLASPELAMFFYDADKSFISLVGAGNASFTTPSNAHFVKFFCAIAYGKTYNHDIQICLNSYADKTTYHPYFKSTLLLPSPVTLRSAGSVADTDELCVEVDGEEKRRQTVRVGQVDLGTLTWGKFNGVFYVTLGSGIFPVDTSNLLCARYMTASPAFLGQHTDKTIFVQQGATDGTIVIDDRSYNDANTLKSDLNGVYLYYALADPVVTLSDPIPDNFLLTEAGGTITPRQTQSKKIDARFDVNYLAL